MPLHLAPLSRRQFIVNTLVAGAYALSPRTLWAQENDGTRWALLSDPHIAADENAVLREVNMAENLRAVVKEVASLPQPPVGVFINGDCALKDGQAGDYATLLSLLKPLRDANLPMHMTLGNHDDRARFWTALEKAEKTRPMQSKHVSLIEGRHANWILLDSLDKVNVTPGWLNLAQHMWLSQTLDAHPDKPALVMVHHNPSFKTPVDQGALQDTSDLFEILAPRKQVKALIYGHSHAWNCSEKDGIHLINLPAVAYRFNADQPTGWVNCELTANGAILELRAHDDKHPKHGKITELKWRA